MRRLNLLVSCAAAAVLLSVAPVAAMQRTDFSPPASPAAERPAEDVPSKPLFYRRLPYGSAATMNPLSLAMARAFHITRAYGGSTRADHVWHGMGVVWESATNPLEAIEIGGGWSHFIRTELFPFRYDLSAGWVSNYVGHTVENGILFRTLEEYYRSRGARHPTLYAVGTSVATSILVEAQEGAGGWGKRVLSAPTVADLWIFEPLGIVLFSSDRVAGFFAGTLGARIWPHMAGVSLRDGRLGNAGLDVVFKVGLPGTERVGLFTRVGLGSDIGVTWHHGSGLDLSAAVGWSATDPRIDPVTGAESIGTAWSASAFIDRDESLLASVLWSADDSRSFIVNVYPGVIGALGDDLGAWIAVTGWGDRVWVGLSHRRLLGLGPAW